MRWTAIFLAFLALVIATIFCAALATAFRVPRGELAAWAQAVGSLVAVGAAIWSTNYQTNANRLLEIDRRRHEANHAASRATRILLASIDAAILNWKILIGLSDGGRLAASQVYFSIAEVERAFSTLYGIDRTALCEECAEALDLVSLRTEGAISVLKGLAQSGASSNHEIVELLNEDLPGLEELREIVQLALDRLE